MIAKLTSADTTSRYTFELEFEGSKYDIVIHTNSKGKFTDEQITRLKEDTLPYDLGYEGEEGELRERIIDFLDMNWDNLVSQDGSVEDAAEITRRDEKNGLYPDKEDIAN